jgi:hypothetical protein
MALACVWGANADGTAPLAFMFWRPSTEPACRAQRGCKGHPEDDEEPFQASCRDGGLDGRWPGSTTSNWPIIPLSSCYRRGQWNMWGRAGSL